MSDLDELEEWARTVTTPEGAAEMAYENARRAHPGTLPKYLRTPFHRLPLGYRSLLTMCAEEGAKLTN